MPRRRAPNPTVNWKRLTIAVFSIYVGLAVFVLLVFELLLPLLAANSQPSPLGVNYGVLATSMSRPLGLILAAIVVLLAPLTLVVRLIDAFGDRDTEWVPVE